MIQTYARASRLALYRSTAAFVAALSSVALAHAAGPVTYYGSDAGTNRGSAHTNSDAAQASFTAAANTIPASSTIITFNSMATGSYADGTSIGGGVTVDTFNITDGVSISNGNNRNSGYNVGGGAGKFLAVDPITNLLPSSVTFTFAPGVQGFGSYFVGLGNGTGNLTLSFSDGSFQIFGISDLIGHDNGGEGFFGFLDPTKNITSLTLFMNKTPIIIGTANDVYGMDNIQVVRAAAGPDPVPEPGVVVTSLSMAGMTGLGLIRGRRRMRKAAAGA